MGVELAGRLAAIRDGRALFSGGLRNVISLADLKMERLLGTFDQWATAEGCAAQVGPAERYVAFPDSTRKNEEKRAQDATHQARRSSGWVAGSGIHGR